MARMTADKRWWPQKAQLICESFDHSVVHFMSSLRRRAPLHIDHQSCSTRECKAKGFPVDQLLPLHRDENCACFEIGEATLIEQVTTIIRHGVVPLVRVKRLPRGQIELEVVKCRSHSRYVALSHVWSDRQLGSSRNALPQCQLEYLDKVLSELPDYSGRACWGFGLLVGLGRKLLSERRVSMPRWNERLFWLDTLCVPPLDNP
jgi:hypothetical protein